MMEYEHWLRYHDRDDGNWSKECYEKEYKTKTKEIESYEEFIEKHSYLDNTHGKKQYDEYLQSQNKQIRKGRKDEKKKASENTNLFRREAGHKKLNLNGSVRFEMGILSKKGFQDAMNVSPILFLYIRDKAVKSIKQEDPLRLYYHYYTKQKKIAWQGNISMLAEIFNITKPTAFRAFKKWVDMGAIKKEKCSVEGYKDKVIYIVGEVNDAGQNKFYTDD